MAENFRTPTSC